MESVAVERMRGMASVLLYLGMLIYSTLRPRPPQIRLPAAVHT